MQIPSKAELHRRRRVKQESHHGPVASKDLRKPLARQNYNGVDTETMVAKQSEGSAEYGRGVQRRYRVKWLWEVHADPSKAELYRHWYSNGTSKRSKGPGPFRGTIEIHASVIRHPEESGQMYVSVMLVRPLGVKPVMPLPLGAVDLSLALAAARISLSPTHIRSPSYSERNFAAERSLGCMKTSQCTLKGDSSLQSNRGICSNPKRKPKSYFPLA